MDQGPDVLKPFPWRPRSKDAAGVVALFLLSRFFLVMSGMLAWGHQDGDPIWKGRDRSGIYYVFVPNNHFIDMWTRWDSWQYEQIARAGYWFDYHHPGKPYGTVGCFPFYPLVVRVVGMMLEGRYVLAGLAVSNLAAVAGFLLLFQWAAWWGDRRAAWVAVSSAIAFPAGLFWSALYPQSLFFALSTLALILMLDGRAASAGLVGAAVTATRAEGIAILPALLAIHLQQRRWRIGREALWLVVTPMGLLAYMAYLYWWWGDPLLFQKVQTNFGRHATNPLRTLVAPWSSKSSLGDFRVLMTYGTGVLLLLGHAARLRWPVLLYGWLLFLIPLSTGLYVSIYRIHLVNVPIYLALGLGLRGRWRILAWTVILIFAVLESVMMFGWVAGYRYP